MDLVRVAVRIASGYDVPYLSKYLPGFVEYLKQEHRRSEESGDHLMYDDDAAEFLSDHGYDFRRWHTDDVPGIAEFVGSGLFPKEFSIREVEKGVFAFAD